MVQCLMLFLVLSFHVATSIDLDELGRECFLEESMQRFSISESHNVDEPIGTLNFTGTVEGPNATITLDIKVLLGEDLRLEGKDLYLKSPLQAASTILISVTCTLKINPDSQNNHIVTIEVIDENLNAPEFQNEPYIVSVYETTLITTTVFTEVFAEDGDLGSNGDIDYSIVQNPEDPEAHNYFGISVVSTGDIYLKQSLDYETKKVWKVKVQAMDRGEERRSATTIVTINVLNGDDIAPYFLCYKDDNRCVTVWYYTTVFEETLYNESLDILPGPIKAVDGDINITNPDPIVYSILRGIPPSYVDYIGINSTTGDISLLQPVSYETNQYFGLTLKAVQGNFSTIALLNISVIDINEFPPTLLQTSVLGYIDENSVKGTIVVSNQQGTVELEISADDKDVPQNGEGDLIYVTNDTSGVFQVIPSFDTLSAKIVVSGLIDREVQNMFSFSLYVMENQTNEVYRSDPVLVTIYVLDVNDEAPHFLPNEYSNGLNGYKVSVRENVQPGHVVFQVTATDPDLGQNGEFDFNIQSVTNNGRSLFSVDQDGQTARIIYVTGILVTRDTYVISLAATDKGITNTQTSVTSIEVDILPTNDTHAPKFLMQQYTASITEEASFGTLVTTLMAVDEDGDPVRYAITNGNQDDAFMIEALSGELKVNSNLDREMQDSYKLTVKASDGTLMDSVDVYITILDSNDNNPIFNSSHLTFIVSEGVPIGEVVGQVMAYDLDKPGSPNAEIEYFLISDAFMIDPVNGVITTTEVLDRETQAKYTITVTAQDKATNPRSMTMMVVITVLDVNDNGPEFGQDVYSLMITENSPVGYILTVKATDPDVNAKIHYMITSGDESIFSINAESGNMSTLLPLDYEVQQLYILKVSAADIDQVDASLVALTTVQIQVQNQNDNDPMFPVPSYTGTVPEYADLGTVVIDNVIATDADLGVFGELTYTLYPESALFISNENRILTKTGLTRATQDNFTLTVVAEDMGVPPRNGTATIFIYITDRGVQFYEQPTFPEPEYSAIIIENSAVNTTVVTLKALANKGEIVTYSIVDGNENENFWISSSNNEGIVMTSKVLDREITPEFSLTIRAVKNNTINNVNKKRKRRAEDPSITVIVVTVSDINDNPPIFRESLYVVGIFKGASSGTAVVTVQAVDPDAENNTVIYSLEPYSSDSQNGIKKFTIDDESGRISTTEQFLESDSQTYKFTVLASVDTEEFTEATADVFVALIEDDHRTILVLSTPYDDALDNEVHNENQLELVLNAKVEIYDIRSSSDPINTDNHFYAISRDTGIPLTSAEIQKLIKENTHVLVNTILPQGSFLHVIQPEQIVQPTDDAWQLEYILIILFAALLFIFTSLAIVVVYVSWKKRQMEREKQARMYVPMYTNLTAINDPNATEISNPVYFDDQSVQASEQLFPNGAPTFLNARSNHVEAEVYDNPACTIGNGDAHSTQREETESEQADIVGSGPPSYTSEERPSHITSPSHQYKSVSEIPDFTDADTLPRKELLLYDSPTGEGYSSSPEGQSAHSTPPPSISSNSPPITTTPVSLQGVYVTPAKDVTHYNPPSLSSFHPIDHVSNISDNDPKNSALPFDLPPPPKYPPPPENYREDDESSYGKPSISSCTESEEKHHIQMMKPPEPFDQSSEGSRGNWNPQSDSTTIINQTAKSNENLKSDTFSIGDSGVNSEHGSPSSQSPQDGSFSLEVDSFESNERWCSDLDNVQITAL